MLFCFRTTKRPEDTVAASLALHVYSLKFDGWLQSIEVGKQRCRLGSFRFFDRPSDLPIVWSNNIIFLINLAGHGG